MPRLRWERVSPTRFIADRRGFQLRDPCGDACAPRRSAIKRYSLCYTKPISEIEPESDRQLIVIPADKPLRVSRAIAAEIVVPAIIADAGDHAVRRFLEFFAATIRNKNTRAAYLHAVSRFLAWCDHHQIGQLADIEPLHVAAYIELLGKDFEKPTVKQHLAAIRTLFDWLVTGQVVTTNPAHAVRGPKHVVKTGKTPVLDADQARKLIDSIDTSTLVGLRHRALISVMTFAFARIGAVVAMRVEDYYPKGKRSGGSACMRKAVSGMRCRRTTTWKPTSTPI